MSCSYDKLPFQLRQIKPQRKKLHVIAFNQGQAWKGAPLYGRKERVWSKLESGLGVLCRPGGSAGTHLGRTKGGLARRGTHIWARVRELHGALSTTECALPPVVCTDGQPPSATSAVLPNWKKKEKKSHFQVWVTSPHLIHSPICELSGVFSCSNSDTQWPAGFFLMGKSMSRYGLNDAKLLYLKYILTTEAGFWFS